MQPMVTIALRAARQAGEMIVKAADNLDSVQVSEKSKNDFVTEIDKRSEEMIIDTISKAYPDHHFLSEESGFRGSDSSDIAAGALLVREAGGFVSDFEGGENFLSTGHVLASTPKLFKPSLQTISKHLSNLK